MQLKSGLRAFGFGNLRIHLHILCVLCLWPISGFSANACNETYILPPNQWHQISLPCKPNNNSSVQAVFGSSFQGQIGKEWAVFGYDTTSQSYTALTPNHNLSQQKAYWIIQISGSDAHISIQGESLSNTQSIPLETIAGSKGWNLVGYPFSREQALNKTHVITDSSQCIAGCDLNDAKNKKIVQNILWHYNPVSKKYVTLNMQGNWSPWHGYWAATLENSHGSQPRLSIPAPTPVSTSISIMLLGDSITQSTHAHYSYRYFLWKKLLDSNVNFDFVGSMTTNYGGNPQWPDYLGKTFDSDHESHWGLRADEVFNILKQKPHKPDIVLVHLGTNDEIQGHSTTSTINDLRNIVTNLRQKNPHVTIFLAKIIPYRSTLNPTLNNSLASLVAELNTVNSPVILVDQQSGFDVNTDTFDRVHPSLSGEQKIADRWYDAIMQKIH